MRKLMLLLVLISAVILNTGCAKRIETGWARPDKNYPTIVASDEKEFEKVKQAILNTKVDEHLDKKRVEMETNGEMSKKVLKEMWIKDLTTGLIGGNAGRAMSLAGTIAINKAHDTELDKILFVAKDYDNPNIKTTDCRFLPVLILKKKFEGAGQLRKLIKKEWQNETIKLVEAKKVSQNFPNKMVFYVLDWKPHIIVWTPIPFVGWEEIPRINTVIELYIDGELAGRYVMAGAMGSANLMTGLKFAFSKDSPYKKIRRWIASHCTEPKTAKEK